jgi:hypothetical protein
MRRLVSLVVLIASIFAAVQANKGGFGMMGPVLALVFSIVALLAGVNLAFNLRLTRPDLPQDSGFGMSEPVGSSIGAIGILVFAIAPLFIAARGLYQGYMPSLDGGPDIVFSAHPIGFVLAFAAWVSLGFGLLWLWRKVLANRRRRGAQAQTDQGDA